MELSSRYVEAGIGISFATIAEGVDALRGRKLAFIPLPKYLPPDYICLVTRQRKDRPVYVEQFISQLVAGGFTVRPNYPHF